MKLVTAIIKPFKLDEVREELSSLEYRELLLPKLKVW